MPLSYVSENKSLLNSVSSLHMSAQGILYVDGWWACLQA